MTTGHTRLDRYRHQMRRERAVRLWVGRCAYNTIGYLLMTAAAVVLL